MAKYTFLALTNPVAGKEDEFNQWYDQHHVPDVLNVPGFISGQRFKLVETRPGGAEGRKSYSYLALYEIETDDIGATIKEMAARVNTADMVMSEAAEFKALIGTFAPLREKVMAKDVKRPRRVA